MKKTVVILSLFMFVQSCGLAIPFELSDSIKAAREAYMSQEPEAQRAVNDNKAQNELTKCSSDKDKVSVSETQQEPPAAENEKKPETTPEQKSE